MTCWFLFHKWSKWKPYVWRRLHPENPDTGWEQTREVRQCERCGKLNDRFVSQGREAYNAITKSASGALQ